MLELGGALRHRNYRLYFAGTLMALLGGWTQSVAQAWLVYRLTGSSLALGAVTFCLQVPVFIFAPLGGWLADRGARSRVVLATAGATMSLSFALAVLTIARVVTIPHLLVVATVFGIVQGFDIPARSSFVIDMVGREDLMNAVAIDSSLLSGTRVLGPAIAGFAITALGEGWCFFANGLCCMVFIGSVVAMRDVPLGAPPPADQRGTWARLAEGFFFVEQHRTLRPLLLLFAVTTLVGLPFIFTLLPVFASTVFHGNARTLGFLAGAEGVGAFLGSGALAARRSLRGIGTWIALASGTLGVMLVLFASCSSFMASLAVLVPLGAVTVVQFSGTVTVIQMLTPDALRGRVMAIWLMILMGCMATGGLLAGWLATTIGLSATVYLGGAVCLVGSSTIGVWLRSQRV